MAVLIGWSGRRFATDRVVVGKGDYVIRLFSLGDHVCVRNFNVNSERVPEWVNRYMSMKYVREQINTEEDAILYNQVPIRENLIS